MSKYFGFKNVQFWFMDVNMRALLRYITLLNVTSLETVPIFGVFERAILVYGRKHTCKVTLNNINKRNFC